MVPYEALYGKRCRPPLHWYETQEKALSTIDFVNRTTEEVKLIGQRMKMAFSRQKSYVNRRRRPLKFQVGDLVFLKIMPMKGNCKI